MSRGSSYRSRTAGAGRDGRGSNTKCVVTIGIILPLLAAVIGVAAWTLSNDSANKREQAGSLYSGSHSPFRSRDQGFSERNDDGVPFGQKLPIGAAVNKDVLGSDVVEERDVLPTEPPLAPHHSEQDPLYVVHYVPQEASEPTPKAVKEPPSPDMLAKILSASNIKKGKGTPQFVVFAPSVAAEEDVDEDETPRQSTRKVRRKKKPFRKEVVEYDEDEYTDHTQIKQQVTAPRSHHHNHPHHHHQHQQHPHHHHQHRTGDFDSAEYFPKQQQPCCQQQGGMMPPATEPPKGISIQLGSGLPASPLGMLRQLLRPKMDLRKKVFFGVQLDNGMVFGGDQPSTMAPAMQPQQPPMHQNGMTYHFG